MGSETGSYGHSGSSGGQPHTAKSLFESRKDYGRNVGTSGEVSQYKIEVEPEVNFLKIQIKNIRLVSYSSPLIYCSSY